MAVREMPRPGRETLWLVLPWLLVLGVAGVEIGDEFVPGTDLRTGSLLSPAPALAAIRSRPPAVIAVSVAALVVGLYTALFSDGEGEGAVFQATLLSAILVVSAASIFAARQRVQREEQLGRVQRVSEAAQLALLPPVPYRIGRLRLEARYVAAEAEARIGGDLYKAVAWRDRARLIIGDVRGKGLPAVRTAAAVLGAFREAATHEVAFGEVAVRCSQAVERLERTGAGGYAASVEEAQELFVTACLVEIEDSEVRVINLGHPAPLLLTPGSVASIDSEDPLPPLGLAHQVVDALPQHIRIWRPGDRLLLYTDGIEEARDAAGTFFPVLPAVRTLLDEPLATLPDLLLEAVARHSGQQLKDDAALLAVEWEELTGLRRMVGH
ncbi:PP2C family protein-serine/threonine phosphatase [Streptomyces sp. JJ36]|uniref:PP2C family protein-serine/threonine phosphatase n=1 Tax=Streptomyces sp. JJ36 TaxID=2736645 RepID=UPI001F3CFF3A|nr:PP2C family protein-serine/threonine phosphatase [Streptomyces sp. JJ36]MCF6525568.1 serine/threonine-protein phosphatase [Streptomyces sp. JJ36]